MKKSERLEHELRVLQGKHADLKEALAKAERRAEVFEMAYAVTREEADAAHALAETAISALEVAAKKIEDLTPKANDGLSN